MMEYKAWRNLGPMWPLDMSFQPWAASLYTRKKYTSILLKPLFFKCLLPLHPDTHGLWGTILSGPDSLSNLSCVTLFAHCAPVTLAHAKPFATFCSSLHKRTFFPPEISSLNLNGCSLRSQLKCQRLWEGFADHPNNSSPLSLFQSPLFCSIMVFVTICNIYLLVDFFIVCLSH